MAWWDLQKFSAPDHVTKAFVANLFWKKSFEARIETIASNQQSQLFR
jgi:hypothetical protein